MNRARTLFLLLLALQLSACASYRSYVPPDPANPVYTLAVLPMYNATNDVGGARTVRAEFVKRIQDMHYRVLPVAEVDRLLADRLGITLGDQLELTTPCRVAGALGVDGLVYGYLVNFDDMTAGVYNVKKVRAGFRLVHGPTGRVIWSRGLGVKSIIAGGRAGAGVTILKELKDPDEGLIESMGPVGEIPGIRDWYIARAVGLERASEAAVVAIGEKVLTRALRIHLRLEADIMLKRIIRTFPSGPGWRGSAPGAPPTEDPPAGGPGHGERE
ncbi:MAG: GNA1162 family protein [Thermodesulfobacteriota bacterium]